MSVRRLLRAVHPRRLRRRVGVRVGRLFQKWDQPASHEYISRRGVLLAYRRARNEHARTYGDYERWRMSLYAIKGGAMDQYVAKKVNERGRSHYTPKAQEAQTWTDKVAAEQAMLGNEYVVDVTHLAAHFTQEEAR